MQRARPWLLAVLSLTGWIVIAAGAAEATSLTPADYCSAQSAANLAFVESSISPRNGATAQIGEPISFSAHSGVPLTFAVASSPATLTNPDIDSGEGAFQPDPEPAYAFTSAKTTATARIVYWQAAFANADLSSCIGLEAAVAHETTRTSVHSLTVVPAPAPLVTSTPTVGPTAPILKTTITHPSKFHLRHPVVSYSVSCTTNCTGDTFYRVLVSGKHTRPYPVSGLQFGPVPLSISGEGGGSERFSHDYRGTSLRVLSKLLRAGDTVKIEITAEATNVSSGGKAESVVHFVA